MMHGALYRNVTLSTPLVLTIALWAVLPPTRLDLALLPVYFVGMNLIEYLLHRWPMHHAGTPMFDHTRIHHGAFTRRHPIVQCDEDNYSVVTPIYVYALMLILAIGLALVFRRPFLLPFASAYYFVEEFLHYCAHSGGVYGRHHLRHHDFSGCNFNINFPIFDSVFGTKR